MNKKLKDAYLSVPKNMKDMKYVRFLWKGVLYECNALIVGLASAPRVLYQINETYLKFAFIRQQRI